VGCVNSIAYAETADLQAEPTLGTPHRVALVAEGGGKFGGIAVGALDMYSFDFVTSKYVSFGEHLDSYDGSLPTLAAGTLGGTPTPIATVLTTHAADIPSAMGAQADPQERQRLFDAVVGALGHRAPQ
jgi:hypothetical protein